MVQVAGLVIVRQRPGTAKGFFFITLEDETGVSNIIVMPELFHKNRPLLHRAPILLVEGVLQKRDGTIGIRGRRFAEIKLESPLPSPHDFH
jgi:error-prone DNA polymerase